MCGICAYIGYEDGYKYVLDGIKILLNRGFDSIGLIGINNDKEFVVRKYANRPDKSSIELVSNLDYVFTGCKIMCGHNRWSTHGAKSDINTHPHLDYKQQLSVQHNGVILNYEELKNELINTYNIPFKSQTDTEVIVQLISVYYDQFKDTELAIKTALDRLEGTWGLVIMNINEPNKLYCARHGSPLLIGFGENFAMVASEQSGFCKYVNNYICLNDHDIIILEKVNGKIKFHKKHDYQSRNITVEIDSYSPDPYAHWTLKEIFEQTESSKRAIGFGGRILNDTMVKLGGLNMFTDQLREIDNLILLGCGTSLHAGLHAMELLKRISGFNIVQIFDGAEFSRYDIPKIGKTALVLLSQSGETRDLYDALEIGKENNLLMIGVINAVDSLIAREVTCGVYLNAGKEMGVASTKAFTSQVIVLYMIAVFFAQIKNINENKRRDIISDLRRLSIDINSTLEAITNICKNIANYLLNHNSVFILGKGICESIAIEGSLKIKEIGYIHAEGYSSAALKHGPYSLIKPDLPVIIVNPNDEHYTKNKVIIEELKAREAYVIAISDTDLVNTKADAVINISRNNTFRGLLSVIPMQLIAYELAVLKGHNPDLPRHLAKTCSVN